MKSGQFSYEERFANSPMKSDLSPKSISSSSSSSSSSSNSSNINNSGGNLVGFRQHPSKQWKSHLDTSEIVKRKGYM